MLCERWGGDAIGVSMPLFAGNHSGVLIWPLGNSRSGGGDGEARLVWIAPLIATMGMSTDFEAAWCSDGFVIALCESARQGFLPECWPDAVAEVADDTPADMLWVLSMLVSSC